MYLKSIEVNGFKSFANRIKFDFHNGITGIVGPNGSGKSNVADAVRWVLGEQRIKQLRGGSMQDVIFSGTETRKPLSYAYVAITLDNSDHQLMSEYDEVKVARRLYRSGESEYSINDSIVRLKDVNELFYDTGIGKEGYSIIGQGQIDKILSGKPEERRELFDEAAGIVKFKRRKATAIKKLEDEQNNLTRVTDILSELERQIGPLERQSEKAKIYLKKKEELKDLDVNVFLVENSDTRKKLLETEEKQKNASGELNEAKGRYERIRQEYEQIENKLAELEEVITSSRQSLSDTSVMREKLEGEIGVLKEQIHSAEGNESHFLTRKEAISAEIAARIKEKEAILADKAETDTKVLELEASKQGDIEKLSALQTEIEEKNTSVEAAKNSIITALGDRAAIKSSLGRFDSMLEQVTIRKSQMQSQLLSAKSDEAEQKKQIEELEKAFEAVVREIQDLHESQKSKEKELVDIKQKMTDTDGELRAAQEQYHVLKSKLDAINNLSERYEGYGGSVRRIMEEKDARNNSRVIGVVADILRVDKEYEVAIETALGGNIQNIVTEDEETAKEMIAFLKKEKAGRATFLPLTSITNPQEFKNQDALEEPGAIGLADSLVHTDKKYQNVAKSMLGRILVVDNVNHALAIAKKYDYGVRMVTLEGELLVPGGAISGGRFKNNSNMLGRRREIEALEKQVEAALKLRDDKNKEIEDLKNHRNDLRRESDEIRIKLQEKFIAQNTARMQVNAAKEKWNETESNFGNLEMEKADIENQLNEINLKKAECEQQLADSEQNEAETKKRIEETGLELETLREQEALASQRVSSWDVELTKFRQQQNFKQLNVDRINGEILKSQNELNEVDESLNSSRESVDDKKKAIQEIEATIKASFDNQNETSETLEKAVNEKETLSERQKNFFSARESLSERIADLDKEVYRLESQIERLSSSMEAQINYMWNEYEITLSDAASLRNEELTDITVMKRDAAQLKDEIKRLGDVNVNAIEEYREVSERYTFLKTQHDDLVESSKTIQEIIDELDKSMRKQFREKFDDISREFDKVFKEMFGGGKGTLELMEDEDLLEAGIKIIAQPPGKKLQNMMQLSGGEKALTAIALLFAIQNLKPSPFCLLDEIEAALDESNVGRFAKYLHKLTKHTQFIVITHRRGTMERADRLYGITMQEKGISKLVSVDLIDAVLEE